MHYILYARYKWSQFQVRSFKLPSPFSFSIIIESSRKDTRISRSQTSLIPFVKLLHNFIVKTACLDFFFFFFTSNSLQIQTTAILILKGWEELLVCYHGDLSFVLGGRATGQVLSQLPQYWWSQQTFSLQEYGHAGICWWLQGCQWHTSFEDPR